MIAAALEVLPADPNASMAAIAERSGLGRTTVYRHFAGRQDLIRAIFEHVVLEAREVTAAVIDRGGSTRETLRGLGPAIVEISDRFQFLAGLRAHGEGVISETTTDPQLETRRFIEAAQARGDIEPGLPVQWILTTIAALGMATSTEMGAGRLPVDQAGDILGEMLVRAFLADRR